MSSRLVLLLVLLAAPLADARLGSRAWVLRWDTTSSLDAQGVVADIDAGLREALRQRGGEVLEAPRKDAIVLRPSVVVEDRAVRLKVVGVDAVTRQVLGSISLRAAGPRRSAVVRALVSRACAEAEAFVPAAATDGSALP
ncbi:MAG: hypothetical protein MUC96_13105 [Myxococcaceae bacterium]|jgi:hypothetical protein|nr:hypothetical protein [Myxococcaceae bacterium]